MGEVFGAYHGIEDRREPTQALKVPWGGRNIRPANGGISGTSR